MRADSPIACIIGVVGGHTENAECPVVGEINDALQLSFRDRFMGHAEALRAWVLTAA